MRVLTPPRHGCCNPGRLIHAPLTRVLLNTQGMHVKRVKFDDSPHVQHLRKHPEEYTAHVSNFIGAVLAADGDNSTIAQHLE